MGECYCGNCGDEFEIQVNGLESCPKCGVSLEDEPPIYYECVHGVWYDGELDEDCNKRGENRDCNCN